MVIGDPNGVGPEIAIQAAYALHANTGMRALLIGEDYIFDSVLSLPALQAARGSFDTLSVGALARTDWQPGTISAAAGAVVVSKPAARNTTLRVGFAAAMRAASSGPINLTLLYDAGEGASGDTAALDTGGAGPEAQRYVVSVYDMAQLDENGIPAMMFDGKVSIFVFRSRTFPL